MPAKKSEKSQEGAPGWMVTYGDMMGLLLCFFIMLVAMSEIKADEKFQQVMQSLREAFGYEGGLGTVPTNEPPQVSLLQRLESIVVPRQIKKTGDSDDEGIEGRVFRVSQVREGLQITVGGHITFDRFSADLKPQAEQLIAQIAEKIRGHTTKIEVRGHTTLEPLPADSEFSDWNDLAYHRAKAVAAALIRHGVDERRIRLTACGAAEPLLRQAYTERRRAVNRRVELIVTESVISDFEGREESFEEKRSDG
jgi:chemotaxis protein MotB